MHLDIWSSYLLHFLSESGYKQSDRSTCALTSGVLTCWSSSPDRFSTNHIYFCFSIWSSYLTEFSWWSYYLPHCLPAAKWRRAWNCRKALTNSFCAILPLNSDLNPKEQRTQCKWERSPNWLVICTTQSLVRLGHITWNSAAKNSPQTVQQDREYVTYGLARERTHTV